MASSSSKKIASANMKTLRELHIISLVVNSLVLLGLFVFKRPSSKWKFFMFSLPAFACQYVLETSGRPIYTKDEYNGQGKLSKSGDDIKGPGLFEYMFDCIYITWVCDLLMLVFGSNKVWFLYTIIPGFVIYKVFSLVKSFSKKNSPTVQNQHSEATEQGKSKRQAKLEKRGQRGQTMRTR